MIWVWCGVRSGVGNKYYVQWGLKYHHQYRSPHVSYGLGALDDRKRGVKGTSQERSEDVMNSRRMQLWLGPCDLALAFLSGFAEKGRGRDYGRAIEAVQLRYLENPWPPVIV